MDDDTIVQQRITGRSVRAIAKLQGVSLAQVNAAIDRWAELQIDDKLRKYTLALELARLDQLQQVFFSRAMNGDASCGALVTKIIERRCTMLGLHTPQTAVLQIVDEATPKETSTDFSLSAGDAAARPGSQFVPRARGGYATLRNTNLALAGTARGRRGAVALVRP